MGTNYYWYEKKPCKECKRPFEGIHIGKSSWGWNFGLHVIPGKIKNIEDWMYLWTTGEIRDEYGKKIKVEEMIKIITNRKKYRKKGFDLMKHPIVAGYADGTGGPTWDHITGEFS